MPYAKFTKWAWWPRSDGRRPALTGGPVDDIVFEIRGYAFVERGRRCTAWGEEFIPEEESQRMIKVVLRLGIWAAPLRLWRKLSRSGRGTVLRIPSEIERSLGLRGNEEMLISKAGKKIIIEFHG